jgi:hypothetical protein
MRVHEMPGRTLRHASLLSLSLLALLFLGGAASAQARPERVRFQAAPAAPWTLDERFEAPPPVAQPQAGRTSRSRVIVGAAAGFAVGAGLTHLFLNSGESNALCDRSRNQDAMNHRECVMITVGGGVTGAALGALAAWLTRPRG